MIVLLAIVVGFLYATGTYLLLQRTLTRIVIGLAMMGHGANLLLLMAGGRAGQPPFVGPDGPPANAADPLPQAMALTAIVITFGIMAFLLALAYRGWVLTRDDEVEDDIEDRRIARLAAELRDEEDRDIARTVLGEEGDAGTLPDPSVADRGDP